MMHITSSSTLVGCEDTLGVVPLPRISVTTESFGMICFGSQPKPLTFHDGKSRWFTYDTVNLRIFRKKHTSPQVYPAILIVLVDLEGDHWIITKDTSLPWTAANQRRESLLRTFGTSGGTACVAGHVKDLGVFVEFRGERSKKEPFGSEHLFVGRDRKYSTWKIMETHFYLLTKKWIYGCRMGPGGLRNARFTL